MPPSPVTATIRRAWLSTGGTGAQNYDEFAADAEITAVVTANPTSTLAVEMPHRTPAAVAAGLSFADALPTAAQGLAGLKATGALREAGELVAPYRVTGPDGAAYGLFCLVDTGEISTGPDQPGLVVRNEEVFVEKVRERAALTAALGHLLSPVLLLQTRTGVELHEALVDVCGRLGEPATTDTDPQGRVHAVWSLPPGADADRLLGLAGGGELVVADGNHRSLAAQVAGLPRFLAVVTTAASVRISPYNRLVRELGRPLPEVLDRLLDAGCVVAPLDGPPEVPTLTGTVVLYSGGRPYGVTLPPAAGEAVADGLVDSAVDRLDHAVVERVVLGEVLDLRPGDPRVAYIGGDYDAGWLAGEVDAGRAEAAVLIAPVPVEDFVAVNLARQTMPRKSTWFTPKARTGLVVAQLDPSGMGASRTGSGGVLHPQARAALAAGAL